MRFSINQWRSLCQIVILKEEILLRYVGTYTLPSGPDKIIVISRKEDQLPVTIAKQEPFNWYLTYTRCSLKIFRGVGICRENGRVIELIVN